MVCITLSDISQKLTVDVINEAYRTRIGDQDSLQSVTITRVNDNGEGLLSEVYRIEAAGKNLKVSFIVKAMVKDEILKRTLRSAIVFGREVLFFQTVLPTLAEFQKSMCAASCIQNIAPICYSCYCDGQNDYILMEDLAETIHSTNVLVTTKERNDRILWTLGHFHSVSIVLKYEKPHVYQSISDKLFETYFVEENRSWYKKYLRRAINVHKMAIVEYLDETDGYYRKFIEATSGDVYGELIRLACESKGKRSAILHGDAWVQNFCMSSNRTVSIDFQLVRDGSPALDLAFFIIICNSATINKEEFDEAISLYYDSLTYHTADMGLDVEQVYPRASLDSEVLKFGKYGYLCSLTTIPLLAGAEICDVLESYVDRYEDVSKIPLDYLWRLKPLQGADKMRAVNALKVAVDVGLI